MSEASEQGCCAFGFEGRHCNNPGTFSTSTSGNGKWLCRIHSQPNLEPEKAIAAMFDSHKAIPWPDYSLAARRQASEQRAWAEIPDTLKGGTEADYRDYIRKGILSLMERSNSTRSAT